MKEFPTPGGPHLVSASDMLSAVSQDQQFSVPERPALVPGAVCVPFTAGLVIDGAAGRQVFRGKAATELLPRILPLLDGTRTVHTIAGAVQAPAGSVAAVVALLYTRGLLVDGVPDPHSPVPPGVTDLATRLIDTTRIHPGPASLQRALSTTVVQVVAGQRADADRLTGLLTSCGVRAYPLSRPRDLARALPPDVRKVLVAAVWDGPRGAASDRFFTVIDAICTPLDLPWIHLHRSGGQHRIGPRFHRPVTACFRCYRAGTGHAPASRDSGTATTSTAGWLPLAATEIFHLVAGIGTPLSRQGGAVIDLAAGTTTTTPLVRKVGCRHCLPPVPGLAEITGPFPAPYTYDQAVAFPPREDTSPRAHQAHYEVRNRLKQRDHKAYANAPMLALPPVETALRRAARAPSPLDMKARVAALLGTAFGLRGPAVQGSPETAVRRYAPTGGNLGSPQAYLINVKLPGISKGVHFYDPFTHGLSRIRELDTAAARRTLDGLQAGQGAAAIVLTAGFHRVASKYRTFALRVCLLDAGVALEQLLTVSSALGLICAPAAEWDDASAATALGLPDHYEPITGIAMLTLPPRPATTSTPAA